jgi:hypothetical protein
MKVRALSVVVAAIAVGTVSASAAVFQYCVQIPAGKGLASAFIWIPPAAKQVRGVVMSNMTLMEREMSKDAQIRKACADEQLAIAFLKCGMGTNTVQKVLDEFARVSGYKELSVAPLFFVGHSAGGPPAKQLAQIMADRCFGLCQYRGGGPWGGEPVPPGVPCLMMVGQFDEFGGTMRDENGREGAWEGAVEEMARFRATNETRLASIVVEPGAGHFAWSDRNAAYLAMFIRKAARARIPDAWPIEAENPVALKVIDLRAGWLTDLSLRNAGKVKAAPYDKFEGEKTNTAWHFDAEMAEATVAYHAGLAGKKDQFITWNDPYWVDAGTRFFFTNLKWIGDGQTFEVHPVYADAYPGKLQGGGPRWADAGKPAGHSDAPIKLKQVSGPVVPVGNGAFRMQYDSLAPATEGARVTFMAYSEGNAEYRHTEQVGMMPRGFSGLGAGKEQTITFPPVGVLKVGGEPVELKATSDSGLPVEYYVAHGPAVVKNGRLSIADLPPRAVFPIEVKVVAVQFGSGVDPKVKTAKPVEQVLQVEK